METSRYRSYVTRLQKKHDFCESSRLSICGRCAAGGGGGEMGGGWGGGGREYRRSLRSGNGRAASLSSRDYVRAS